jgi:hypothetical protein
MAVAGRNYMERLQAARCELQALAANRIVDETKGQVVISVAETALIIDAAEEIRSELISVYNDYGIFSALS